MYCELCRVSTVIASVVSVVIIVSSVMYCKHCILWYIKLIKIALTVKNNGKISERHFDRSSAIIKFNVCKKITYIIYGEGEFVSDVKGVKYVKRMFRKQ